MRRLAAFASLLLVFLLVECKDEPTEIVHTGLIKDITEDGALFSGSIQGVSEITEYGFVWSTKTGPTLPLDSHFTSGTGSHSGAFESLILSDLGPLFRYYVRTYVKTSNSIRYGEEVQFLSKGSHGPTISSFAPSAGTTNDILTISGTNFSFKAANIRVTIGPVVGKVLSSTDTQIKVQLPLITIAAADYFIVVIVNGMNVTSTTKFHVH